MKGLQLEGGVYNEVISYIQLYLHKEYRIDHRFNYWQGQIEHYAYIKELSWTRAFDFLLREMIENSYEMDAMDEESSELVNIHWSRLHFTESVLLKNGDKFEIGEVIKLNDLIGNDYARTKFFNAALEAPSWELFYSSEKDYGHVQQCFMSSENEPTYIIGNAWRLLSGVEAEIEAIALEDGKSIAYCYGLRIELESALLAGEIRKVDITSLDSSLHFLQYLNEDLSNKVIGLVDDSFEAVMGQSFFNNLHIRSFPWHRFDRNIRGKWYERKRSG